MKNIKDFIINSRKNIIVFFKNHLIIFGILVFVIVAYYMYHYGKTTKNYYLQEFVNIQILNDTTPNFVIGPNDYIEHNKIILSILQGRETTLKSELTAKNDVIWQMRTIYFAVLAGLLTILLSKRSNQKIMFSIILFLIIINYLLDVHLEDQYNRKSTEFGITKGSVDSLLRAMTNEKIWYDLNYTKLQEKLVQGFDAKYNCDRWARKILIACRINKNLERIVYYIIPFFAVYLLALFYLDSVCHLEKLNKKNDFKYNPQVKRSPPGR